jgi:hypothetical protein
MPESQIPAHEVPHMPHACGSSGSDVHPVAQAVNGGPQVVAVSVMQAPAEQ